MSKSIYEKWNELNELHINDSQVVISNCYLSSSAQTRLYIGTSQETQYIFIEFDPHVLDQTELPELKGVEVSLNAEPTINKTKEYIKIRNKTNNTELFVAFSSSLCDSLMETTDYYSAFNSLVGTIKEYKDFFACEKTGLSLQEEQGLCAELLELEKLLDSKGEDAVRCWMGPSRNKRDFLFSQSALEIKSTLSQLDSSITISNENQLSPNYPNTLSKLLLKVYVFERSSSGINVENCAQNIMKKLHNIQNKSYFNICMLKMKIDLNTYKSKFYFTQQAEKCYCVTEHFPKITKEMLPAGIFGVKYRLHLDSIKDFEITGEEFYGLL